MGVTMNGATPAFVEPDDNFGMDSEKIEEKNSNKTKAILVTHLYGMTSRMDEIVSKCKKYNLRLVEDCAQSHGSRLTIRKQELLAISVVSFFIRQRI